MNDMTKQFENFTEMMKSAIPQITPNKNGYEIRTKVLEMAQTQEWKDFNAKWGEYQTSVVKDEKTGELVTSVTVPSVPGVDQILETANKFYEFVNNNTPNKK